MRAYVYLAFIIITSLLLAVFANPAGDGMPAAALPLRWTASDLRALDPPDATHPGQDILAVYWQQEGDWNSLRLDFLDMSALPESDLLIALDHASGGVPLDPAAGGLAWDTLLTLPASGGAQAVRFEGSPLPSPALSLARDPQMDSLVLRWRQALPQLDFLPLSLQVLASDPASGSVVDYTPPIDLHPQILPRPLPVLFAFWNVFPAYTPAQALRRWDGAHTGPFGGRHGLFNLLRVFRAAQTPLTLLDAKLPASLAALEMVDGVQLLDEMVVQGLLILPEAIPYDLPLPDNKAAAGLFAEAASLSRQAALNYGLPAGAALFAPQGFHGPPDYPILFTRGADGAAPSISAAEVASQRLFTLSPSGSIPQITPQGLSLEARRSLALAAASGASPLAFFGGDLPRSGWGAPAPARLALSWIANHPWLAPVYGRDLLTLPLPAEAAPPAGPAALPPITAEEDAIFTQFASLPGAPISQAASDALLSLYQPVSPSTPDVYALRAAYLPQLLPLATAARWAAAPKSYAGCSFDLNQDGEADCILASHDAWAWILPDSGALIYFFIKNGETIHQLIAPSSQFTLPQSDPAHWRLDLGLFADPAVVASVFHAPPCRAPTASGASQACTADAVPALAVSEGSLKLSFQDSQVTFSLIPRGIQVERIGLSTLSPRLTLAPDPWRMSTPGWSTSAPVQRTDLALHWQFSPDAALEVRSPAPFTLASYTDTSHLMKRAENPNLEFPPAHFLPFPLATVTLPPTPETILIVRLAAP